MARPLHTLEVSSDLPLLFSNICLERKFSPNTKPFVYTQFLCSTKFVTVFKFGMIHVYIYIHRYTFTQSIHMLKNIPIDKMPTKQPFKEDEASKSPSHPKLQHKKCEKQLVPTMCYAKFSSSASKIRCFTILVCKKMCKS